jgi:hypothetical protein
MALEVGLDPLLASAGGKCLADWYAQVSANPLADPNLSGGGSAGSLLGE